MQHIVWGLRGSLSCPAEASAPGEVHPVPAPDTAPDTAWVVVAAKAAVGCLCGCWISGGGNAVRADLVLDSAADVARVHGAHRHTRPPDTVSVGTKNPAVDA